MTSTVVRLIDAVNVEELPLEEPEGWLILAIAAVAVLLGPFVVVLGVRQLRQGYRIFANDPVGAGDVPDEEGIVEVEGTARPLDETLTGKYSGESALVQSWRRERKRERTDDDGNTTTEWRTDSKGTDSVPFLVEDETGSIGIDPSGATISVAESELRPDGGMRLTRKQRRYREYEGRIEPGDEVHVYGQKRDGGEQSGSFGDGETHIGDGDAVAEFVVSDGSELRTVLRYLGLGALLTLVGALWIPLSVVLIAALIEARFGIPITSWLSVVA